MAQGLKAVTKVADTQSRVIWKGGIMKQYLNRFWTEETGQSTTEYILILAVVVMVTMRFKTLFQSKLEKLIGTVGDEIDQAGASNSQ